MDEASVEQLVEQIGNMSEMLDYYMASLLETQQKLIARQEKDLSRYEGLEEKIYGKAVDKQK
jgi:hypothetical protein